MEGEEEKLKTKNKIYLKTFFLTAVYGLLTASIFLEPAYSFFPFDFFRSKPKGETTAAPNSADQPPLTLEESYRLALQQSEDVAMKREELEKAQGHLYLAINEIAPEINFLMTDTVQDAPKKGTSTTNSDTTTSNLSRRTNPQKKFTLHQPIFSGFKEIAGLQGAGAEKAQKKYEKQRAEETLLSSVVDAFYSVIQAEKDIQTLEESKKTLENRIQELKDRVQLGRSRESEIQTALSDEKVVESQLVSSRSQEVIARQTLEYYIGRTVEGPLVDMDTDLSEAKGVDDYLDKLDTRSDVKAANEAYILAEKNVVVERSGFFPSVYLDGNYYTQRVGSQSGIDWDAVLSVKVPVFNGTQTFGDVKVAAAEKEMAKYNFLKTKRLAKLDIRKTLDEYKSIRLEEVALGEAVAAKKKDYELEAEEYKLNLVNNLDVLKALKDYQDLSRDLNQTHYDVKRKYWALKVAVGETIQT